MKKKKQIWGVKPRVTKLNFQSRHNYQFIIYEPQCEQNCILGYSGGGGGQSNPFRNCQVILLTKKCLQTRRRNDD